ncbi:MAG: CatB-related O-acetyltransferase [Pseudonocardiaceae bacterium]
MSVPDPTNPYPLPDHQRYCVFVRPTVTSEKVEVGEFTYYDASQDTGSFEAERVLYGFGPERLLIGRFCAIAAGARFVMSAANHLSGGPSTFPFTIFPGRWRDETLETFQTHRISKGDTVVGNDVWFGRDMTVLPGVTIGDGAIIGTAAVVTRDVAPYTVVGGNPAQLIKRRYSDAEVELLQRAAWWDWPIEVISAHAATLMAGTPAEIAEIAAALPRSAGTGP